MRRLPAPPEIGARRGSATATSARDRGVLGANRRRPRAPRARSRARAPTGRTGRRPRARSRRRARRSRSLSSLDARHGARELHRCPTRSTTRGRRRASASISARSPERAPPRPGAKLRCARREAREQPLRAAPRRELACARRRARTRPATLHQRSSASSRPRFRAHTELGVSRDRRPRQSRMSSADAIGSTCTIFAPGGAPAPSQRTHERAQRRAASPDVPRELARRRVRPHASARRSTTSETTSAPSPPRRRCFERRGVRIGDACAVPSCAASSRKASSQPRARRAGTRPSACARRATCEPTASSAPRGPCTKTTPLVGRRPSARRSPEPARRDKRVGARRSNAAATASAPWP